SQRGISPYPRSSAPMADRNDPPQDADDPGRSIRAGSPAGPAAHDAALTLTQWSMATAVATGDTVKEARSGNEAAQFVLRRVIGRGGMGEVWEAEQSSL